MAPTDVKPLILRGIFENGRVATKNSQLQLRWRIFLDVPPVVTRFCYATADHPFSPVTDQLVSSTHQNCRSVKTFRRRFIETTGLASAVGYSSDFNVKGSVVRCFWPRCHQALIPHCLGTKSHSPCPFSVLSSTSWRNRFPDLDVSQPVLAGCGLLRPHSRHISQKPDQRI
jgi:hypothetical protein